MAINVNSSPTGVLFEEDLVDVKNGGVKQTKKVESNPPKYKREIVWRNVILFGYLHIAAVYGFYLMLTSAKVLTIVWAVLLYQAGGLGITAGAHRLWSHRAYKAKWPLRLILVIFNTLAFQNHVHEWARDHRVHHKYSETNADPHNATRGFFFSHIGWLLCRKHPSVKEKGKGIDISDLDADPILAFQKKYYMILMPLACFVIPTLIPMYLWNESFTCSWFVATLFRYTFTLNMTWLVNSAAHIWGSKPYDKTINPSENLPVAVLALGEGWHNYHHVFPWDYKTAELGNYRTNFTTAFIDFFAWLGWAYDLKTVPLSMVESRVKRTGDGSHEVWGWNDKDLSEEEKSQAEIISKRE
uniref:Acyl-CoA Delta(11) desaturase n=1 Tax=Orthetrum albistylum TaxID=254766 RepID=A0A499UF07_9ODON|nr:acyl-CoA Delta(11) desaturase [Orthetrum albistylum]